MAFAASALALLQADNGKQHAVGRLRPKLAEADLQTRLRRSRSARVLPLSWNACVTMSAASGSGK